jgi:hypothetical protein
MTNRSADHTKDHTEVTMSMQRKTRRVIVAIAVIALLAAGGAAFTTTIGGALDGQNANIGFGSETITGATAKAVNYQLDSNGQYINDVDVVLVGDFSQTGATDPWSFTGSLTDNLGAPLQWNGTNWVALTNPGGSGKAIASGQYPYNDGTNNHGNCTAGSWTADGTDPTNHSKGTTSVACNFLKAHAPWDDGTGLQGVPVNQVEGFQFSVTGNNSTDGHGNGGSQTLGGSSPNP